MPALWSVPEPKGRKYEHKSKQKAVASLLLAEFVVNRFRPEGERAKRKDGLRSHETAEPLAEDPVERADLG